MKKKEIAVPTEEWNMVKGTEPEEEGIYFITGLPFLKREQPCYSKWDGKKWCMVSYSINTALKCTDRSRYIYIYKTKWCGAK